MKSHWRTTVFLAALLVACESPKRVATTTFYQRRIEPILLETCANSPTQSGCHVAADDRGNAFGNLNVSSYDTLLKRKDLLIKYGPYGLPAIIVKALPPMSLRLSTWESADPIVVTTDIPHAGGSLLDVSSTSYIQLLRWIERGATESNAVAPARNLERAPCSETVGTDPQFDPTVDPSAPDYATFQREVNPVLGEKCAAGNCHGAPSNSLYLTCGKTPEQTRWNYFVAGDYVSIAADTSELLRRPLDPAASGVYHEGGVLFTSTSDPGYRSILKWATEKGGPTHQSTDPGFLFFAHRVQPMFVKKGCVLIGCHSPAMGHEYRLRSGSGGHFGLTATRRNYELTLEQVALESPDPNTSRVLRKNLVPFVPNSPSPIETPHGILHRGGSLFGVGRTDCDAALAETGPLDEQEPYCIIAHWIGLERQARMGTAAALSSVVYVKRTPAPGRDAAQDFETYAPGADLLRAPATFDNGVLSMQGGTSLLGACGLSAGIDVRRPAVSWDAKRIAFSARGSAGDPWRIYVIDEGGGCAEEPGIAAAPVDDQGNSLPDNGELLHNFDPTFAPDGRIVFVSTRGNVQNAGMFDYQGPQRTPADPSKLNANLYVLEADGRVRQLTFLLNQELTPSFMSDGRLTMTTEKRAAGFYQLAGRRENLDGGDYHPLFGQRATIGYRQVTDIVELADKNFAAIFSDPGAAHGAGALGVVNRSLGVDQQSDVATDYLQDRKAKDWPNPNFYQHSVRILDGNGRVGQGGGAYRNPTPLPDGKILVSYAPDVPDLADFSGTFGLYVMDPVTGERTGPVQSDADDLVWPVAVYERPQPVLGIFKSKPDEPNGSTRVVTEGDDVTRSDVTFLDLPLLSSLMFQNTRSKRLIPAVGNVEIWEDLPPESGVQSYADGGGFVVSDDFGQVYVRRRLLGDVVPLVDGSAHMQVPGGVPIVLAPKVQLDGDTEPVRHHQLEEMQFYPGEVVRQGFKRELFNGVCASCHGAVTGYDADISVNPDILTQASRVGAKDRAPAQLLKRDGKVDQPPFP